MTCTKSPRYFTPPDVNDLTVQFKKDSVAWTSLNEKEQIDEFTRIDNVIYCGVIACNIEPIEEIDIATFEVLPGTNYARDKHQVYYPLEKICFDGTDCGVCFCNNYIVEFSNPDSFKYLGQGYAKDRNRIYFKGNLVKNADANSFKLIAGPEKLDFGIDKNYVFKKEEIFHGADPKTFEYIEEDLRNMEHEYFPKYILRDRNKEWEYNPNGNIIKEAEKI